MTTDIDTELTELTELTVPSADSAARWRVRGGASPEQLAALLAVLGARGGAADGSADGAPSGYERWRAVRRRALANDHRRR